MAYKKRNDGRAFDETRPITAEAGIVSRADGSARFQIGKTVALAAVFGPRELHPKFLQNPEKGILRVRYNMLPFSGHGDRVRPGGNRRSKEISYITEKALMPVIDLNDYPNSVVDVFIELPQTDAGTRCAGICAASIALADAGIKMKDLVQSVAIGRVEDAVIVDLDYSEEAHEPGPVADIPVAIINRTGEISLLQMDGDATQDILLKAMELAKKTCNEIYEIQKEALKKKYEVKVK